MSSFSPNIRNKKGRTPLHEAIRVGDKTAAEFARRMSQESIADHPVDINSQEADELGSTAMHLACRLPSLSIIQELLDSGAVDFRVLDNRLQLPSRCVAQSYLSSKKNVQLAEKRFFAQRLHSLHPDRIEPGLPSAGYYLYQKPEPVEVRSSVARKFSVQQFASRLKHSLQQPSLRSVTVPEDPQSQPRELAESTLVDSSNVMPAAVLHSNGQRFMPKVRLEKRAQPSQSEPRDAADRVKPSFIPKHLATNSSRAERSVEENASTSKVP